MADSDTEGGFDPAALLQMDMEDAGSEISASLDMIGEPEIDLQDDSDTGNVSDQQQTPTKNDRTKLKSFDDEKQFISLMELANMVQREEMDARSKFFNLHQKNGRSVISRTYSHCTICETHIPIIANQPTDFVGHPILKTLVCKRCFNFYGDGNFDRGEDGIDLYCRWCAEGGTLFCCSTCPNVFCKKCVRLNFGVTEVKKVNDATSWSCYICEPKLLWGYRAIFAIISQVLADFKSASEDVLSANERIKDLSACCTYRSDLKQYMKSQYKLMSPYCTGVLIPQIKPKMGPPTGKKVSMTPSYAVNESQGEVVSRGQVNDFFANGHFLEPALAQPPSPPRSIANVPPPRSIAPVSRNTPNYVVVRQIPSRPPVLIRPRNLSVLQAVPYTRASPPALIRRNTPTVLRSRAPGSFTPRFAPRGKTNYNKIHIRGPRAAPSPSFVRAPNNVSISSPSPATRIVNNSVSTEAPAPTPEWLTNILDQALLSADFYKDEIIKLKLKNMSAISGNNVNMKKDAHVLNTVKCLNWIMKSMLEQGLDIRRTISKQYPKMDSANETVNMDRLHKLKGFPTFTAKPVPSQETPIRIISGGNRVTNSNTPVVTYRSVNGNKSPGDIVDLVSDEEDNDSTILNKFPLSKKHSLTISPVQSINNRISLPNQQRIPLTPTPSNRLSIPATHISHVGVSPSTKKRRKKKVGSDDSEDDDYIPKANPTIMKKRRKTNQGLIHSNNFNKTPPKLMVTNIRSLQTESTEKAPNISYLNQVSEDVMEKVLQTVADSDSDNSSDNVEQIDSDPLDDSDRDDWIAQNPTAYEKYCLQYNLVKDWYIAVKNIEITATNR